MRPNSLNPLFAEATALPGVGPAVGRALSRLGIDRAVDLLFHLPVSAIERVPIEELSPAWIDRVVTIEIVVLHHLEGRGKAPTRVACVDRNHTPLTLVYFADRGGYAKKILPPGERRLISGRLEAYGTMLQIIHPDHVLPVGGGAAISEREPVYGLTDGIANRRMGSLVALARDRAPNLPEWIEPSVLATRNWPGWKAATEAAHTLDGGEKARDRLAYDELLANQLALMLVRADTRRRKGRALPGTGKLTAALAERLPWPMTGAQRRVSAEIAGDLAQGSPMLRLLQGDVGSGKTLVALQALLTAVESGAQGAFLAPTEILARQHLAALTAMLGDLPVRVAILTGREKGKVRADTLADLASGEIDILVGTHAIFQEAVTYRDLGLAVIDEQHKFGVHQRLMLANKAERPAHVLVMTATPIPRTLAMVGYADLDVSIIDELPPARKPIQTVVLNSQRREELITRIRDVCAQGRQAYWVCTLIDESDLLEAQAASAACEALRMALPELRIGLIHGRLKAKEKEAVMAQFSVAEIDVLVATTVIEVGVDVPNASLMLIENAERLGLSQLHQLRGRVGRGSTQSCCVLMYQAPLSNNAKSRLAILRESNDGFVIAERDLELRGPGELLGTKQTGDAQFRIADLQRDMDLLAEVAQLSAEIALADPEKSQALVRRWIGAAQRYAQA